MSFLRSETISQVSFVSPYSLAKTQSMHIETVHVETSKARRWNDDNDRVVLLSLLWVFLILL